MSDNTKSVPGSAPIAVAADHGGFALKETLRSILNEWGYQVLDLGAFSADSVDYPAMADNLAGALADGSAQRGILVCGSGIGISIAANRHAHIRCALCHEPVSARLARQHNDANVLALGGRLIGVEMARACVDAFLTTEFEGGRHVRRVAMLARTDSA
jgi:ribose 5-phosphate isomerase B